MKRKGKYIWIWIVALLGCFVFGTRAAAAEEGAFVVRREGDGFVLYDDRAQMTERARAQTLAVLIDTLNGQTDKAELRFDAIATDEPIAFNGGEWVLSGEWLSKALVTVSGGARVTVDGESLRWQGGVRIKDGALDLVNGELRGDACAVTMDYASSSVFVMTGGTLYSGGECALRIRLGTAHVRGGSIEAPRGLAIENRGSLFLSGSARILGASVDVSTDKPVSISDGGVAFVGEADVRFERLFAQGEATVVFYGATGAAMPGLRMTDAQNRTCALTHFAAADFTDERNFLAVYRPFRVGYYVDAEPIAQRALLRGDAIAFPDPPERTGYSFVGWFADREGERPAGATVTGDTAVYARYALIAPTFSLSSLSFVYDGEGHTLGFSRLSHPLSASGVFTFVWEKDGVVCESNAAALIVREVADGGRYACRVTFSHGADAVSVTTPTVTVEIAKKTITPPSLPDLTYNGEWQRAAVVSTSEYTVEEDLGGIHSGDLVVRLRLTDPKNTRFFDTDADVIAIGYAIRTASNAWVEEPGVVGSYLGGEVKVRGAARFGTVKFLYAPSRDGDFSERVPNAVGTWYMRAVVEPCADYLGISSEPIAFSVLPVSPIGLRLQKPPTKTEYAAFEVFSADGMEVYATYSDGSTALLRAEQVSVSYATDAGRVRYGDRSVVLGYEGISLTLPITVKRATYDLSSIGFSDGEAEYNGAYRTLRMTGELPIGADGVALRVAVCGGGVNVGVYRISLVFSTDSADYLTPAPMEAELTVTPWQCTLSWSDTDFVYDGSEKCPRATYVDRQGTLHAPSVRGGMTAAGASHMAVAASDDPNVAFLNPTCPFEIRKARYDMSGVRWSEGRFVYDGTERRVTLSGLPSGVTAVGYADNVATDAGVYHPAATLSYDAQNYEPPVLPEGMLVIEKASFDLSAVSFPNKTYIYDGSAHVPEPMGELPRGCDGSTLAIAYDRSVTDVCEGEVSIAITLTPTSKNYKTPPPMQATVRILPKPIVVVWGACDFVYDGEPHLALATTPYCSLTVRGAARDAGAYTATAVANDPNYIVENGEITYRVERAPNAWERPLSVCDVYESGEPSPVARASFGTVRYEYYAATDPSTPIPQPTAPGAYLVRARCEGDRNHLPIDSEPLAFRILAVVPIALSLNVKRQTYRAYDTISADDLEAKFENNDGSFRDVPFSELTIDYPTEDSLRVGDRAVEVWCGALCATVSLRVSRYVLREEDVIWSAEGLVYDGAPHAVSILSHPSFVRVEGYESNILTEAGEHLVLAHLLFDAENVDAPRVLTKTVTVARASVPVPSIPDRVYDGAPHLGAVADSALYTAEQIEKTHAGVYRVRVSLTDPKNHCFATGDGAVAWVEFRILPREIDIAIDDVVRYRDLRTPEIGYTLLRGEIVASDDIGFSPQIDEDGTVRAVCTNPDYRVTVREGRVIDRASLSPAARARRMVILPIAILLVLVLTVLLMRRGAVKSRLLALSAIATRLPLFLRAYGYPLAAPVGAIVPQTIDPLHAVDVRRADTLITDPMARALMRRVGERITTFGRRRAVINVDTLCAAFKPGDRVDVNRLKRMGLVPYDTAYLKVLARGVLDKPLIVCANDFSLAAVKMIALTGGEAIRVRTARAKTKSVDL